MKQSKEMYEDLFNDFDRLPVEIQAVFNSKECETYDDCEDMLRQCEALGYTFEYYLDAVPYNLKKIR